jgi:hypothetical protein
MALQGVDAVKKAIRAKKKALNDGLKAQYIKHLSAIITSTPVHFKDGGRLRNNWFLSVGSPEYRTSLIASKQGASSMAQIGQMPDVVIGKKIYFTNNLPYANVVEYGGYPKNVKRGTRVGKGQYQKLSSGGYSKQAPSGMVRINMVKLQNGIKQL